MLDAALYSLPTSPPRRNLFPFITSLLLLRVVSDGTFLLPVTHYTVMVLWVADTAEEGTTYHSLPFPPRLSMLTFHNPVDTGHQERNSLCNDCSIKSLPRIRTLISMSLRALNSFFRGMIRTVSPASAAARLAGLAKSQPPTKGSLSGQKMESPPAI